MPTDYPSNLFNFWVMMERAHYVMHQLRENKLAELDLSIPKMKILNTVFRLNQRGEPVTPSILSKSLLRSRSTITERLNRLEEDGLVKRVAGGNKDNRRLIELTALGYKVTLKARGMEVLSRVIYQLSDEEREVMMNGFRKLLGESLREYENQFGELSKV